MNITSIGIIGKGDFGTFIEERARAEFPWVQIRSCDRYKPSQFTFKEVIECDVVIPAVPPEAYVSMMRTILPLMSKQAVLVDICTAKVVTVEFLRAHAQGHTFMATHPLFGRQSFIDNGNSVTGLQIALCEHNAGPHVAQMLWILKRLRLKVVQMSAYEHDSGPGIEQLSVQYYGLVNRRTGLVRNEFGFHTRSALHFLRAMEIVENDEALFEQVAKLNPYWPAAKRRIQESFLQVLSKNGNGY